VVAGDGRHERPQWTLGMGELVDLETIWRSLSREDKK
jgi:hypothetical protein